MDANRTTPAGDTTPWQLRLYIAGRTPKSLDAYERLKKVCEEHLGDAYHIEVVDLLEDQERAVEDGIVALPTLVRKVPEPLRRIIGNFTDKERLLCNLEIKPRTRNG